MRPHHLLAHLQAIFAQHKQFSAEKARVAGSRPMGGRRNYRSGRCSPARTTPWRADPSSAVSARRTAWRESRPDRPLHVLDEDLARGAGALGYHHSAVRMSCAFAYPPCRSDIVPRFLTIRRLANFRVDLEGAAGCWG